jgi:hypothetical protein
MTFRNNKQKIEFDYNIGGAVLERLDLVSDLGVLFDNKLSFIGHMNSVPGRLMAILLGIPEISLMPPH